MEPKQKPSVGRIVHFFPSGSKEPEAAVVIAVWSETCVNLSACNANGTWRSFSSVSQGALDDVEKGNRWDWPARV